MKRYMVLALGLTLTGCATTRYVPIKCISPEQYEKLKQAEPPKVHDKLSGRADEDVKVLGGSAVRLRAWGGGLLTVLEGCKG